MKNILKNEKLLKVIKNLKNSVNNLLSMQNCFEIKAKLKFLISFPATSSLTSTEIDFENLCSFQIVTAPLLKGQKISKFICILHLS